MYLLIWQQISLYKFLIFNFSTSYKFADELCVAARNGLLQLVTCPFGSELSLIDCVKIIGLRFSNL